MGCGECESDAQGKGYVLLLGWQTLCSPSHKMAAFNALISEWKKLSQLVKN